jgi:hypothetical protein
MSDELIARLLAFDLTPDNGQDLDALIRGVNNLAPTNSNFDGLFRFLERSSYDYNLDDYCWGILHTLERLPGYEASLIESVRRNPSDWNLRMVMRIFNSLQEKGDVAAKSEWIKLLEIALVNPIASRMAQKEIAKSLEKHTGQDYTLPSIEPYHLPPDIPDPLLLLGKNRNDPAVQDYFRQCGGGEKILSTSVSLPRVGIEMLTDRRGRIHTVFLFLRNTKDHYRYVGPLPQRLDPKMTTTIVHGMLGKPDFGGNGFNDRYDGPTYSLHIEYSDKDGKIRCVTLMTPDATPGRKK